jgi:hypothetical protein
MSKRLVKKGCTVIRDGRRVRPTVGEEFDFTKAEIDGLNAADPAALAMPSKGGDEGEDAAPKKPARSSAQASQAAAKDGEKKATANKSDEESADADGDDDL